MPDEAYTARDLADQAFTHARTHRGEGPLAWHLTQWAENYPDQEEDTNSQLFMVEVTLEIIRRKLQED